MAGETQTSDVPEPGAQVSRREDPGYTVHGELRRGGMGAIMLAHDLEVDRDVAMKLLIGDDPIERKRFQLEARLTGSLEHPNIVPIHSVGLDKVTGRPFFTMKLIDGENLREILQNIQKDQYSTEEWNWPRLLNIFINICHAMEFAHSRQVIHRDLKPSNIMVGKFGEVQVMDWGVAKDLKKNNPDLDKAPIASVDEQQQDASGEWTSVGDVIGTIAYMPPEQALGKVDKLDERSDVYSLGAILYEILCLRPPIKGGDVVERLRKVEQNDIEWPHLQTPERKIPRDLSYITMKALAQKPRDRYQSAAELREDVERYLQLRSVQAVSEAHQDTIWLTYLDTALKFVRRHFFITVVTGVSAILLMLVFFIMFVVTAGQKEVALEQKRLAEENFDRYKQEVARREALREEKLALEERQARDALREWRLEYSEDFRRHADDWEIIGTPDTRHEVKDGELFVSGGQPHLVVFKEPIVGDIKFEFDCRLEGSYLNDISCFMSAFRESDPASMGKNGYYIAYGSHENKRALLSKAGKILYSELKEPLRAGKTYHFVAERIGAELRLTVNGNRIFTITDPKPLSGSSRNRLGIFGYVSNCYYDNIKIYRLAQSRKVDILELADYYMNLNRYETAQHLYENVVATAIDLERKQRARAGVGKALEYKRKQNFLETYQKQADRAFKGGSPRVSLTDLGLELDASGLQVNNLRHLQGMPFNYIDMSHTDVYDLTPMGSMPIRYLDVSYTPVDDLRPIEDAPLEYLDIEGTDVANVSVLKGKQLHYLNVSNSKVKKVNVIRGMPLRTLYADGSTVDDVSIFKAMPLLHLALSGRHISDLTFIEGKQLYTLKLNDTGISDIALTHEMPLETLHLKNTLVSDISALRGKEVRQLNLSGTPVTDFSLLKELNVNWLDVSFTKFNDLSLLDGKRLQALNISYTELKDLSSIRKIIGLKTLYMLGCHVKHLDTLRHHDLERLAVSPNLLPSDWQSILRGLTALRSVYGLQTEMNSGRDQDLNQFMRHYKDGTYD